MLNRDPSVDYVLTSEQALWVDLDQPTTLETTAAEWLEGSVQRRNHQPHSLLKPEWELSACLERWQNLLNQALAAQAASGS